MRQIRIQVSDPGFGSGGNGGPGIVTRVLLSIVAVIMLVSAAFLGAIVFLAALGFFAVAILVLAVRIWWAKRQLEKAIRRGERPGSGGPGPGGRADVIEGEYLVMEERQADGDGGRNRDRETEGER
jgi:hypothetical protein